MRSVWRTLVASLSRLAMNLHEKKAGGCVARLSQPWHTPASSLFLQEGTKLCFDLHFPVIVAVAIMRVVQVAFDEVIHMIPVRNLLVAAVRSVTMLFLM